MEWEYPDGKLICGDLLEILPTLEEDSVDLVFCSPPYEDSRLYLENGEDLGIARKTDEWVLWMRKVFKECLRVCKGLVAMVVGHGKGARRWSAGPALLCADLLRLDKVCLRSPLWYKRQGIMGSGGNDWMRADLEWIICAAKDDKKFPWSDNVACGHPPKYGPGGPPSHQTKDGRVNRKMVSTNRKKDGSGESGGGKQRARAMKETAPKIKKFLEGGEFPPGTKISTIGPDGADAKVRIYVPPEKSNPGNVIDCGMAGGGHLGSKYAHDNEAPFHIELANFMIKSFCPPGGTVLDCFFGSGTTVHSAIANGRKFLGIDIRESQIDITRRRIKEARMNRGFQKKG